MGKDLYYKILLSAFMDTALSNSDDLNIRDKPCPSKRVREEVCPTCDKVHRSNKSIYCSKECNPHIK